MLPPGTLGKAVHFPEDQALPTEGKWVLFLP